MESGYQSNSPASSLASSRSKLTSPRTNKQPFTYLRKKFSLRHASLTEDVVETDQKPLWFSRSTESPRYNPDDIIHVTNTTSTPAEGRRKQFQSKNDHFSLALDRQENIDDNDNVDDDHHCPSALSYDSYNSSVFSNSLTSLPRYILLFK